VKGAKTERCNAGHTHRISPKYCWMLLNLRARGFKREIRPESTDGVRSRFPSALIARIARRLLKNFLQQEVPALLCRADPAD